MRLVYVAHPFSGDEKRNTQNALAEYKQLVQDNPDITFISPILAFGELNDTVDYEKAMEMCLELLARCDALVLTGNWYNSKGCLIEQDFMHHRGKRIINAKSLNFTGRIIL